MEISFVHIVIQSTASILLKLPTIFISYTERQSPHQNDDNFSSNDKNWKREIFCSGEINSYLGREI